MIPKFWKIPFLCLVPTLAMALDPLPLETHRLSGRLLVVQTETGNSNVAVLSTQKGLVMIDAGYSPSYTRKIQEIAEKAFNRSDWYGLVLTNQEMLNFGGGSILNGTTVITHEGVARYIENKQDGLADYLKRRADEFRVRVDRSTQQLAEMEPGSDRAAGMKAWIHLCRHVARDWDAVFALPEPDITFQDGLTLDLGDLTLNLMAMKGAPEEGLTFAWCPEEAFLWTGDFFHAHHILPTGPGYGAGGADIASWLQVMDTPLNDSRPLKHIYRTNGKGPWTRDMLKSYRRLIHDLNAWVMEADSRGETIQTVLQQMDRFEEIFPFLKEWDWVRHASLVRSDLKNVALGIWKRTHASAAEAIYSALERNDSEEADALFHRIQTKKLAVYCMEREFNRAGYLFMGQDETEKALRVFTMTVSLFPGSANAWDSLGEARLAAGDRAGAIESYQKSLELNPENQNAKDVLTELGETW